MNFLNIKKLSRKQLIIAAVAFGILGTILTLQSRAASNLSLQAAIEGESMKYSSDVAAPLAYTGASGGKVINMFSDGTITSPVITTTDTTISVQVMAKGTYCDGNPQMIVKVDNKQIGSTYKVSSRSAKLYDITSSVPAGTHTLSITFPNDAYKKGVCDRNLYIDKTSFYANTPVPSDVTAPIVSVTNPLQGATVTGQFQLGATSSDNVSVTKVEFYSDSTLLGTSLASPYSILADSTKLANGQHSIYAKAYDSAGNVGSSSVLVNIANVVASPTPTPQSTSGLNVGYFPKATSFINAVSNPVIRSDSAAFMTQFKNGNFWNPNMTMRGYGVSIVKGTGQFTAYPAPPPAEGTQYIGSAGKFQVPKVPAGTKPAGGTDGHLAVVVGTTVYEIYKATISADGTITNAKAVARADLNGNGQTSQTDAPSNAAGLSLLAGIITPEELASGHIDHALAFSVPGIKSGPAIFPAWSNVYVSGPNTVLAEGSKIQLDPSVNISNLPEPQKTIAKALQVYGAYLRDNGGTFSIYGETSNRWPASYGSGDSLGIGQIPWASVRVIN